MVKYNYFETLEKLSHLSDSAVRMACGIDAIQEKKALSSLRRSCDTLVCELEDTLFSDFLPPLERESLAACAHALSRITDRAFELITHTTAYGSDRLGDEGKICVKLSERLKEAIGLLRKIRRPQELPDVQGFRALLCEGRTAHADALRRLHGGSLPRATAQSIIFMGRLRAELSRAFDELVEIMLHNI